MNDDTRDFYDALAPDYVGLFPDWEASMTRHGEVVEALIDPTDTPAFVPVSECIRSPGPRVRKVSPGRITDLELQQFIITQPDLTAGTADLDACRG